MSSKKSSANRNSHSNNRQRNTSGSRGKTTAAHNAAAASNNKKSQKTVRSLRRQGKIRLAVVVLCWLMSFLAMLELFIFNVLPRTYFLSACVIITMINILLTAFWKKTPAFVLGILYALLMTYIVYLVGKANNVLDYITTERDSYINVNVYVDEDDPAKELSDASDYTFGYVEGLDEANMARALKEIQDKLGHEIAMQPYTTTDTLFAGLANKEVGAALINESYVTIYDDNLVDEINKASDSPVKRDEIDTLIENSTRIIYTCSMLSQEETTSQAAQETQEAVTTEEIIPVTNITSTPFIVYVSGSDTRRQDLSVEERSDVNIMVVINPVKHQVLLVSTPRDFAVPLADHDGWLDKLTNAGIYGVNSSVKTLENLYGVDISYYAKINFAGFREIVNALGGVDVWSDYDFKSSLANSDVYYKKGWNHLGGQSALYFVRERYAFKSGDWQRSRNQMHMIKALEKKLESPAVLTGYNDLMNAIADCFLTNMPRSCIEDLVSMQISNPVSWHVDSTMPTGEGSKSTQMFSQQGSNTYITIPDYSSIEEISGYIHAVLNGTYENGDVNNDEDTEPQTETDANGNVITSQAETDENGNVIGSETESPTEDDDLHREATLAPVETQAAETPAAEIETKEAGGGASGSGSSSEIQESSSGDMIAILLAAASVIITLLMLYIKARREVERKKAQRRKNRQHRADRQ